MKKIICFINSLTSGGAEKQLVILSQFLSEEGYDVTFTTLSDVPDFYSLPTSVKRERIAHNKPKWYKLFALFKYFLLVKSDVIISYGQRENFLCLLPLLFRRNINVISGERNFSVDKPDFIERILISFLYKRSDSIVPNSYAQRDYIIKAHPEYNEKVYTIINYTDKDKYTFSETPCNKVRMIGVFCRYDKQKNCERVVEAIKLLKNEIGPSFKVDWYGNIGSHSNPNPYYNMLEESIKEYQLHDVFETHDSVPNVQEMMAEYDLIALLSLHEGFSNTISEAISCGRALVVSDVSDNSVMVKEGENGFLCDPGNIASIVSTLKRILELSDEELRIMGRKSRKIAEALFDKSSFVNSYIELIER